MGIGATNYQTVLLVVLPAALPSIITGATLSVARAAGETAPLIFTALFSPFWLTKLTDEPVASLAVLVFNFATSFDNNQQSVAWAASLVLVLMVLIASIIARVTTRSKS